MNFGTLSFKNPVLVWNLTFLTLLGGVFTFNGLSRLEDPPFTIKSALIYTAYPGATAAEVEGEVTEPLEAAIQKMDALWRLRSLSKKNLSVITVDLKKTVPNQDMQQTLMSCGVRSAMPIKICHQVPHRRWSMMTLVMFTG